MSTGETTSDDRVIAAGQADTDLRRRRWVVTLVRTVLGYEQLGVLVALLGLVGVVAVFHPTFLSSASLIGIGQGAAFYGIMALGMVFLLSMREIDLSVGSNYALSLTVTALLITSLGWNPWLAALAGLLLSMALGAANGALGNVFSLPVIIVTLGTLSIYRGLTLVLTGGQYVPPMPESSFFDIVGGRLLGVPVSVWSLGVLTVLMWALYNWTRFGFVVRAIGANDEAARLSGIPIGRIRVLALTLMGGLCGVAAMLTLAFFESADASLGIGYELLVIAAAIIGGTSLAGGSGTVIGALLGALIISVIQGGLVQFSVDPNWSMFFTGTIIVAAVAVDALLKRRRVVRRAAPARPSPPSNTKETG